MPGSGLLAVRCSALAQERAQTAGDRLALLAEVSSELAGALSSDAATRRLPALLAPALADGCNITVPDDRGHRVHAGSWHVEPKARTQLRTLARRALVVPGVLEGLRARIPASGQPAAESDHVSSPGAQAPSLAIADSLVVVPIERRGRALGELTLLYSAGRSPSEEDLASVQDIAHRTGLALDNARLYTQQRQLAEELQHSLLTASPAPQSEHTEIVVRYLPAAEVAAVGGDWYDAFCQDDGSTVLIIGDVVGHDIAAAATMGQLRGLLRGSPRRARAAPHEC